MIYGLLIGFCNKYLSIKCDFFETESINKNEKTCLSHLTVSLGEYYHQNMYRKNLVWMISHRNPIKILNLEKCFPSSTKFLIDLSSCYPLFAVTIKRTGTEDVKRKLSNIQGDW